MYSSDIIRKQLAAFLIYGKHQLTSLMYLGAGMKSKRNEAAINRHKESKYVGLLTGLKSTQMIKSLELKTCNKGFQRYQMGMD